MDVRETVRDTGRARQGLVTTEQLRRAGVGRSRLSRAVARGDVVRVRPGIYAAQPLAPWPVHVVTDAGVAPDHVARVRAALLSLGPGAAAGGRTAACLRGWGLLHEPLHTVEIAVPADRGRVRLAGVRAVRRRRLATELVTPVPGQDPVAATAAVSTVLHCCAALPLLDGVVVCDSALRSRQVTVAELEAAARRLGGRRRAARVRRALALCDPECGSVLESVLRFRMVEAGFEGFATQVVLTDARGRYVRRVDFCFAAERVVVETDGARWHDVARDQAVDNRLAAAGWRVLRFSWAQVVHDAAAVLGLVRAALDATTPAAAGSDDTHLSSAALSRRAA